MRLVATLFTKRSIPLQHDLWVLMFAWFGGWVVSWTHLSVGWLLGSLFATGLVRLCSPQKFLPQGLHPLWRQMGQILLAIQIGRQADWGMILTLKHSLGTIFALLSVSILLSLLSGFVLWNYTNLDLLTCLYGTTPGGVSAMPAIAAEAGANSVLVTAQQVIRNLQVITLIPMITTTLHHRSPFQYSEYTHRLTAVPLLSEIHDSWLWTIVCLIASYAGYRFWKRFNLPAPALVGGLLGTFFLQSLTRQITGISITPYWPDFVIVLSQVMIGASIGMRIERHMLGEIHRIIWIGGLCSLMNIWTVIACSIAIANWIGIQATTSILAFAPGGIAEMAITATVLHADAPLIVTVQTLRLLIVLVILPPFFRMIQQRAVVSRKPPAP
jgi:uncharacterized protein